MDSTSRKLPGRVKESYTTGARSLAIEAAILALTPRIPPRPVYQPAVETERLTPHGAPFALQGVYLQFEKAVFAGPALSPS